MLIIINGGISSGKSTIRKIIGKICHPVFGKTATIDVDDVHQMLEYNSNNEWVGKSEDWSLTRKNTALLSDNFLCSGCKVVVIVGPFFYESEITSVTTNLKTDCPIYLYTLECSDEERIRRDKLRPDAKSEFWWTDYLEKLKNIPRSLGATIDTTNISPDEVGHQILKMVIEGKGRIFLN